MNTFGFAIAKSVALHTLMGVMLFVSMEFAVPHQPELPSEQPIIQAVVIDQQVIEQQYQKIEQEKRAEQQRAADAERKRQQQLEEQRAKQRAAEEAKRKRIEAEKREKERQRKEQEEKRKAEEQARKLQEQKEREERARQEAERKRREEQERAEQERILQEQLQAEQAARQQKRNQVVLTEVQKYQGLIRQTIQRHLIVDESYKGKSCRLNIRLASNGLVTQVRILEGDTALCRAAETAVLKPDTLPVSPEPDVFEKMKDINLTVEPQN
ncbi:cell envelope integrity protein TolA [Aestuariibacter salexigens]|uniref:cell envelope integrity protein TolA n=1 Tax=Aestuariibacter salexigens TaxID=226010 RepID=UPI0004192145|nr:cell envelope integrity protein TolA [Aestuariibacter salexigens]